MGWKMCWEGMGKALGGDGESAGKGWGRRWASRAKTPPLPPSLLAPAPVGLGTATHLLLHQPCARSQQLLVDPGASPRSAARVEEQQGKPQLTQRPPHLRLESQLKPQPRLGIPLHCKGKQKGGETPGRHAVHSGAGRGRGFGAGHCSCRALGAPGAGAEWVEGCCESLVL